MLATEDVDARTDSGVGPLAALDGLLLAASAASIAAYLWIALHRLDYPFDLEWMEGAGVDHVARILAQRASTPPRA